MKVVTQILIAAALLAASLSWAADEKFGSDLEETIASAAAYESGQSLEPFRKLEEAVRASARNPAARREIEAGLIRLLETNSTFEARKFACKQLGIIGTEAALPALSKLLTDPETSGIACLALTTYPPGKADELLRAGLRSENAAVRMQLAATLGDRRDVKSISPLTQLAWGPDQDVAEAAISALGKIGTKAALKALDRVRDKAGGELNGALGGALLRCAGNLNAAGKTRAARALYKDLLEKSGNIGVRRSALSALLASDQDDGKRRILDVLSRNDEALKPVAIAAIASVSDPGASEEFAMLMHHLSPQLQVLMVQTLAERGDDAARLQLAKALSLPEPMVRCAAIEALGRMADPYFVSLLTQAAAASTDPQEARDVETALVGMKGGAETDKKLVAQLRLAPAKARVVLIATLAQRQGAAAAHLFLEETANFDPVVAKAAFRALAKVGTAEQAAPVVKKLLTLEDAGVQAEGESAARQLLGKMPEAAQRSAVVLELLPKATTVETRSTLLALLPACGDAAALAELKSAVGDSEPEVREAAVRALADWPNDSAWDELARIYALPRQEKLHSLALPGLVRLLKDQNPHPDATLIGRYKQLFSSARSESDLKLLLGAVADVAHPDALPLVLPFVGRKDVRAEAVLAVQKIAEAIKAQHPQVAEEALKKIQSK